jgi:hypothetical protein
MMNQLEWIIDGDDNLVRPPGWIPRNDVVHTQDGSDSSNSDEEHVIDIE